MRGVDCASGRAMRGRGETDDVGGRELGAAAGGGSFRNARAAEPSKPRESIDPPIAGPVFLRGCEEVVRVL